MQNGACAKQETNQGSCNSAGDLCNLGDSCCGTLECLPWGYNTDGVPANTKICRDPSTRTVSAGVRNSQISFARPATGGVPFSLNNPTSIKVPVGSVVLFNSTPTTSAGNPLIDGWSCSDGTTNGGQNFQKEITATDGNIHCVVTYSLYGSFPGGGFGAGSGGGNKSCVINPSLGNDFNGVPGLDESTRRCEGKTNELECLSYRCVFESHRGRKGLVGCSTEDQENLESNLPAGDRVKRVIPICNYQ